MFTPWIVLHHLHLGSQCVLGGPVSTFAIEVELRSGCLTQPNILLLSLLCRGHNTAVIAHMCRLHPSDILEGNSASRYRLVNCVGDIYDRLQFGKALLSSAISRGDLGRSHTRHSMSVLHSLICVPKHLKPIDIKC